MPAIHCCHDIMTQHRYDSGNWRRRLGNRVFWWTVVSLAAHTEDTTLTPNKQTKKWRWCIGTSSQSYGASTAICD